jgi:hypothetical protein
MLRRICVYMHIPKCAQTDYELPLLLNNTASEILLCVYMHIPKCAQTDYELPLLLNNTASEIFLHKSPAWR